MDSNTTPARTLDAKLSYVWRVEPSTVSLKADKAQSPASNDNKEETRSLSLARERMAPGLLLVQVDVESGRFVQTLKDASTEEVVWKYPSEAQLAFSRAVNAYRRANAGA